MSENTSKKLPRAGFTPSDKWTVQSDVTEFGHRLRIHQHDYMIIMQIDNLCMVGFANEHGNFVLPHKLPIVDNLDAAKELCEIMLMDSEVW